MWADGGFTTGRSIWGVTIALLLFLVGGCASTSGVYHQVKAGETLYRIARDYHVSPTAIAQANNINDPRTDVKENMILFIPGGSPKKETSAEKKPPKVTAEKRVANGARPQKTTAEKPEKKVTSSTPPPRQERPPQEPISPALRPKDSKSSPPEGEAAPIPAESREAVKTNPAAAPTKDIDKVKPPEGSPIKAPTAEVKRLFVWPYQGKVTSTFGPQPNGMVFNHIRIEGGLKEPVLAAAAGTVIFSATLKDFGETVMIKHEGGFTTVYTHMGSRTVRKDDQVTQGEKIGAPRPTGKKDRGYIHFEIRDHTKPVNPLSLLPPR